MGLLGWSGGCRGSDGSTAGIVASWRAEASRRRPVVDYPGLNLRLVRVARRWHPHAVLRDPTVWAWHESRVGPQPRRRLLVILPFEERFFAERGVLRSLRGPPWARGGTAAGSRSLLKSLGLDPATLSLAPARQPAAELRALARCVLAAGREAQAGSRVPLQLAFAVATAPLAEDLRARGRGAADHRGGSADLIVRCHGRFSQGRHRDRRGALLGTQWSVAYRMNPVTLGVARRLVADASLRNGEHPGGSRDRARAPPTRATPSALAAKLLPLFEPASPARREMLAEFDRLRAEPSYATHRPRWRSPARGTWAAAPRRPARGCTCAFTWPPSWSRCRAPPCD